MKINLWKKQNIIAKKLYKKAVGQARQPVFYLSLQIPDSPRGRFDLIVLHTFLILHILKNKAFSDSEKLAQDLFDIMCSDIENNLREMGVSDQRIGKNVESLADQIYAKILVYDNAILRSNKEKLKQTILENLYQGIAGANASVKIMVNYFLKEVSSLEKIPEQELLSGRISFSLPEL